MEKNPVIQMKDDYQELELGTTLADLKMSFGSRVYLVLASNPKKAFHSGSYVLQKGTVYILRDPAEVQDSTKASKQEGMLASACARMVKLMAKRYREEVMEKLDIWSESKRSKSEQLSFKAELIAFYKRQDPNNQHKLLCMALDTPLPRSQVRAAHIWKSCTRGDGLEAFGLDPNDVHSPRNGILLAEPIEQAFDVKSLCFTWDPFKKELIIHVLDPALHTEEILSTGRTFATIHGQSLKCPSDAIPFRRILSFHARLSFKRALQYRWITEEQYQQFKEYLELSEGAIDPHRETEEVLEDLKLLGY